MSVKEKGVRDICDPSSPPPTYPVENLRPSLHGDALEDGQHGEEDVVEGGDAVVGPLPALLALGGGRTDVGALRRLGLVHQCAGRRLLVALYLNFD